MSTPLEQIDPEPRKLGVAGKAVVTLLVVSSLVLGTAAVLAIRKKRLDDEKRERTMLVMKRFLAELGHRRGNAIFSPPPVPEPGKDSTGQRALYTRLFNSLASFGYRNSHLPASDPDPRSESGWQEFLAVVRGFRDARDAWGNPYVYRCAGPIHRNGWDLISSGPNGVYDEGAGDDLVVGEDVTEADEESARDSNYRYDEKMRRRTDAEKDAEKARDTKEILKKFAERLRELGPPQSSSSGEAADFTGQRALRRLWHERETTVYRDEWGHAFHYHCPGPIHKNGFDLISCGPNGTYEQGGGDDVVVGEDLPGGVAAITSVK